MDEFNEQQDALMDNALYKLAIVPLPPDFTRQVMANVQALQRHTNQRSASAPIRFRLQFLDIALALFWSSLIAVVWVFVLWLTGNLPFDSLLQIQQSFSIIEQLSLINPAVLLGGIILLLLEISLLGLIGVNLLGERPSAD